MYYLFESKFKGLMVNSMELSLMAKIFTVTLSLKMEELTLLLAEFLIILVGICRFAFWIALTIVCTVFV